MLKEIISFLAFIKIHFSHLLLIQAFATLNFRMNLKNLKKQYVPGMGIEPMLTFVNWILSPTP